jgi:DNA-binding MarR family transcriptional regulator
MEETIYLSGKENVDKSTKLRYTSRSCQINKNSGGIELISRFELLSSSVSCIYRYIQKIERVEMAKYGLKGPHAQCLLAMNRYPEGITASKLCEICDKDKAAVSRTVAELEQAGMITRDVRKGKRYRSCLKLTSKGVEAARAVNDRASLAVEQAGTGLDEEKRQIFYSVLGLIAGNLQAICRDGLKEECNTQEVTYEG